MMLTKYDTIFTKKVLLEKIVDPSDELYIYVTPRPKLKGKIRDMLHQIRCAKSWAQKLNMKAKVMAETDTEPNRNTDLIFGYALLTLLKMVSRKQVKNIFVQDVNLFCNNKYITAFIIGFLNKNKINLYTANGLYKTDSNNYSRFEGMVSFLKDYDLLTDIIMEDADVYNKIVEEVGV